MGVSCSICRRRLCWRCIVTGSISRRSTSSSSATSTPTTCSGFRSSCSSTPLRCERRDPAVHRRPSGTARAERDAVLARVAGHGEVGAPAPKRPIEYVGVEPRREVRVADLAVTAIPMSHFGLAAVRIPLRLSRSPVRLHRRHGRLRRDRRIDRGRRCRDRRTHASCTERRPRASGCRARGAPHPGRARAGRKGLRHPHVDSAGGGPGRRHNLRGRQDILGLGLPTAYRS